MNESKQLLYMCKNCNHQEVEDTQVISEITFTEKSNVLSCLDKSIKHDPSLPRTNLIVCPNSECKQDENKVIYIKANVKSMKFLYFCCHCEQFWTNNKI